MSAQLAALADEVFAAAAAQGRAGGRSVRHRFGEVVWNDAYPDLFFLNAIVDLVAPQWAVPDLERVMRDAIPQARCVRAISRDPGTISALGPRLVKAGYESETRVFMVQVSVPDRRVEPGLSIAAVDAAPTWVAFDELTRINGTDHGWTDVMTDQMIALTHWRAEHTPHRYYLARVAERAVAQIGLYQHGSSAYLHGLFTTPPARRRGAGAALTLAMGTEAGAMGCDRLTLQCASDGHLPAYYQRLGFRVVGEQQIWTKPAAS